MQTERTTDFARESKDIVQTYLRHEVGLAFAGTSPDLGTDNDPQHKQHISHGPIHCEGKPMARLAENDGTRRNRSEEGRCCLMFGN